MKKEFLSIMQVDDRFWIFKGDARDSEFSVYLGYTYGTLKSAIAGCKRYAKKYYLNACEIYYCADYQKIEFVEEV